MFLINRPGLSDTIRAVDNIQRVDIIRYEPNNVALLQKYCFEKIIRPAAASRRYWYEEIERVDELSVRKNVGYSQDCPVRVLNLYVIIITKMHK